MSYIYKIINDINNKIYIGQTSFSLEKRFKEHLADSDKIEKRPLYYAMRKYGKEHFKIELIEETNFPNEKEKYWINYYDSYNNGYNATLGGEGISLISREKVFQLYKQYKNAAEVARQMGYSSEAIRDILSDTGINLIKNYRPKNSKQVYQYDSNNNLLNIFWSSGEAAEYIIQNKHSKGSKHSVANKIRECANKTYNRKSAFGFIWKYDS